MTFHTVPAPRGEPPPIPLGKFDIESIRVASEHTYAQLVEQHPSFARIANAIIPSDTKDVRRALLARSLRLTESMAAEAYRVANEAMRILGVSGTLELYQRSGPENASMHIVQDPIMVEIHGGLLSKLDERAMLGVFGHELGHYIAHGRASRYHRAHFLICALDEIEDNGLQVALSRLSMMGELTADRVGLLVCQDLTAMLRLETASITGLASHDLTWDTEAYLAQCRDLIEEELRAGPEVRGVTHPEHSLRAYALWLFSETREYKEITGRCPGTRNLAEVDSIIAKCFKDDTISAILTLDHSRLGEPPQELHECALACAVLVACSDGEMADEEREEIERLFSSFVPD